MLLIDFAKLRDKGLLKTILEDFVSTKKKTGYPAAKLWLKNAVRRAEKQISRALLRQERNVLFFSVPFR